MRTNSGDKELGERIRQLRRGKDLTQEQLAELSDISYPLLQKIEQGASFGSKATHEKLAKTLGVSVQFLLFGEAGKPKSRIPDLPPDPPLEPELQAILDDPDLNIYFSRSSFGRLSNRQLRQIALNIKMMIEENEEREKYRQ